MAAQHPDRRPGGPADEADEDGRDRPLADRRSPGSAPPGDEPDFAEEDTPSRTDPPDQMDEDPEDSAAEPPTRA
ncbi:hypothetical protein [Allonocardiopsis opalescens]|uniref:Uncharacterized protein n=1 Tax=Allonocardiopsis opalescens TaxID=1144618 RepID=A0A2T0PXC5_9ACTN|nr:hypothetical protein [Allonocardiopsis opalescens]PRX96181.1 hypothetical protein CLV72_108187 [Allonocardiopsis opalescens]